LETDELEFPLVEDFLTKLKKKYGRGDNELANVVELNRIE